MRLMSFTMFLEPTLFRKRVQMRNSDGWRWHSARLRSITTFSLSRARFTWYNGYPIAIQNGRQTTQRAGHHGTCTTNNDNSSATTRSTAQPVSPPLRSSLLASWCGNHYAEARTASGTNYTRSVHDADFGRARSPARRPCSG
ncbi:hypothetical protein BU23DRAFT_313264 [Bimuria novae-zelandiae CBS 107.79]|uniref:Uncharacterized protein n=1 Tax=Bimuria novae-zelandiae CBS 107.79 TaxID=1447943 RepID=A0A6A5UQL8_9PLEO|nr:hypothetical protein BU23DRAFT_313264 [Bimuria novae-zelandiae CBS 107.79]